MLAVALQSRSTAAGGAGSFVGVAFFAHVGGLFAGVLMATLFASRAWPRELLGAGHRPHGPRPAV